MRITYRPGVDGPGRHGELVRLFTNDRRASARTPDFPLSSGIIFFITVR